MEISSTSLTEPLIHFCCSRFSPLSKCPIFFLVTMSSWPPCHWVTMTGVLSYLRVCLRKLFSQIATATLCQRTQISAQCYLFREVFSDLPKTASSSIYYPLTLLYFSSSHLSLPGILCLCCLTFNLSVNI